jgi:hypothetical protein
MADTEIRSCNCSSKFQDERYGKQMRVHNPQQGKNKGKLRCTVCGNTKG